MILSMVQMQLIFINSNNVEFEEYETISKFGLMHILATNVCEWLYVVIEEAKHEILHVAIHHHEAQHDYYGKTL